MVVAQYGARFRVDLTCEDKLVSGACEAEVAAATAGE